MKSFAGLALAGIMALGGVAWGQAGIFDLQVSDHVIGRDTFKLEKTKSGFKLSSQYKAGMDTDNQFKLNDAYGFIDGTTTANNAVKTSLTPNKARTELSIGSYNGAALNSDSTPIKPALAVLPNFDAGAAQVLLLLAVTHPTADNLYSIFLPASGGGGSTAGAPTARRGAASATPSQAPGSAEQTSQPIGNRAYDALWVKGKDVTGALNGSKLTLHTYALEFGKRRWIFIADDANTLMQVSVDFLNAQYIRTGFRVDLAAAE